MTDRNRSFSFFFRVPLVIALIINGTQAMNAQKQITGTVHHADQPIPYATVTLNADSTSSSVIKGYATTNDKGIFTIEADASVNDWLIIRCLGYKEQKKQVSDLSKVFEIQMEEDALLLDEIKIKGNYSGIKFTNDTVSFDTKHYAVGTEENIGDVLKKIPGMEVTETGKVSYTGKNIGKVLIDGRDVMSSSGNLAINNLSADLMESAEVLLDYTDSSITNAFKKDETLALNIKTSKKKKISGYIQGAAGYDNKYQAKSSILHIGEKGSLSAILSANNVGDAVFSIEDYISNIVGIDNLLSQKKNTYKLSSEEAQMLLPPDNVYEHTNGALSINTTYVPSARFNFKGNIIYNGSFLKAQKHSEDQYFSGNFVNRKEEYNKDNNHYVTANFQESWKSGNFELNSSTRINIGKYNTWQTLENDITGNNISSENDKDLLSTQFIQDLNTNSAIGKGILYSYTHLEISERDNDYNLLTDSLLLPIAYSAGQGVLPYNFSCRTINRKTSVSPEIGYIFPVLRNINLNTSLSYHYANDKITYSEEKENDNSLTLNKFQFATRLEKSKGLFRFGLGVAFSLNDYKGNWSIDSKTNKCFVSPDISLQLVFSPKHRLSLSSSYEMRPTDVSYLAKLQRVVDYNEIISGSDITDFFSKEANVALNYSIFDLYTNTTFFLFANYMNNKNVPKECITQKDLVGSTTYQNNGEQEFLNVKTYLNKGLTFIPVDAKLTCSYAQTEYMVSLNNADNRIKAQSVSPGISFASRFKSAFNVELGVDYQYNSNTTSDTDIKNTIQEWDTTIKLHYSHNKIKATLYGTYLNIDNPSYRQDYFDIGFNIEYRLKDIGIKLLGRNLLHLENMEWLGIYHTPYYTSTSLYKKIPGHLQCSLSYSF